MPLGHITRSTAPNSNQILEAQAARRWEKVMIFCGGRTNDHKAPVVKETRIGSKCYTYHTTLPRGISSEDLACNLEKSRQPGI